MKKALLTLVCACALTLGTVFAAQAETTGVYVAPKFLMMWQNNHANLSLKEGEGEGNMFNSQFTLGGALAVGYDFFPQHKLPIRAELEFAMRGTNDYSEEIDNAEWKSSINASTLMANMFYDFHNDSDFTPYVTAGAGLAFIQAKNEVTSGGESVIDEKKHTTNFAWNLGAGVAYNLNENLAVDLGYRYVNMGSVNKSVTSSHLGHTEFDNYLYNHEIALGVRYTF